MSDSARTNGVCVVTGSTSGIGMAVATRLVKSGYDTVGLGRDHNRLSEQLVRSPSFRFLAFEQGDPASVSEVAEQITDKHERLTALIHCGGGYFSDSFLSMSLETFDEAFRTNLRGPVQMTQLLIPSLALGKGTVVFMNSSIGRKTPSTAALFSSLQFALSALTDSLRDEVNSQGVRVVSVFPGRTATPRTDRLFAEEERNYRPDLLLQPEAIADVVEMAIRLPNTAEITDLTIRSAIKSY